METKSQFQFETDMNRRVICTMFFLIPIMSLLLLYIVIGDHVLILHTVGTSGNVIERSSKLFTTFKHTQSLSLPSIITPYIH